MKVKQHIRSPFFERLFRQISVFPSNFRFACYQQAGRVLYVSGALRRTYTLFYPGPLKGEVSLLNIKVRLKIHNSVTRLIAMTAMN